MIQINPFDNTYIKLVFNNERELGLIWDYFSVPIPGAEHTARVKSGLDDGMAHLVSRDGRILLGLKDKLKVFCTNNNIVVQDKTIEDINNITKEQLIAFINKLDLPFEPYDHQIEGVYQFLKYKRRACTIATGGGKSLVAYIIARFCLANKMNQMLIVPTVSLVYQMKSDFLEYYTMKEDILRKKLKESYDITIEQDLNTLHQNRRDTNCDLENDIHCIIGGEEKVSDKLITISTYQSIIAEKYDARGNYIEGRVKKEYFEKVEFLLIDEMHSVSNVEGSIANILKYSTNATFKCGMSGSVSNDTLKNLSIEGLIGTVVPIISIRELIDLGMATNIVVSPIFLKYNASNAKSIKSMKYPEESKFTRTHEQKAEFIAKFIVMLMKQKKNVTYIYNNNDHGDLITEKVVQILTNTTDKVKLSLYQKENPLNVYYAKGTTKADKRELFRQLLEESTEGGLFIGNTKIISTGINIKNLHVLILGQMGKAYEVLLQSLGRLTRLHESKTHVDIYDLVDDARYYTRYGTEYPNYSFKHFIERLEHYNKHELEVKEPKSIQIEEDLI